MVLDKQRKHYDDSMNQAIKMTRQGYSKSQWERMVKAMEVMQTVTRTLIMAGCIIIGLWAYAELTNQELHITGKDYCCYPCPNNTEWNINAKPMQPIQPFPLNQSESHTLVLDPCASPNTRFTRECSSNILRSNSNQSNQSP